MSLRMVTNPPNPYLGEHREWLEPAPEARLEVYEETATSVLTENDSPDVPFRWSVNPYRGCQHACAYCYARPYHEYLGMGAGTDFDTKIVVKVNAAERLREELSKRRRRSLKGSIDSIVFSGVTDCYQPLESVYGITRKCLEVCLEFGICAGVITKSYLVLRDAHLLGRLNQLAGATVYQSIPFADDAAARKIEPHAPSPTRRFEAMRQLSAAGIPVGVMVAPIIPGLNDKQIPDVLRRAADAGARFAGYVPLRLPGSVATVFIERLRETMPLAVGKIESRIREMRNGRLNNSQFGDRMHGQGEYWKSIKSLFEISVARYGLNDPQHHSRIDREGNIEIDSYPRNPPPENGQMFLGF